MPTDKTFEDLVSLLRVKQDERKRAYNDMQLVNTEKEIYKKQVEEYVSSHYMFLFLEEKNSLKREMNIASK